MVKIIQAYSQPSPFAAALENFAKSQWGDTLTPALKREKLYEAQTKNQAVDALIGSYGGDLGAAFGAGIDPRQVGYADLVNTGRSVSAGKTDPFSNVVTGAQIGSGMGTPSTSAGALMADDTKRYGIDTSAATSRANNAASNATARANAALAAQAAMERLQWAEMNDPTNVLMPDLRTGGFSPTIVPRSDAFGARPVLSETDTRGTMLSNAAPNLTDEQMLAAIGALPSMDETKAGMVPQDLARDEVLALIGAEPKGQGTPAKPDFVTDGAGNVWATVDGFTDLRTGEPLPPNVFPFSVQAAQMGDVGLANTNATESGAQETLVSGAMLNRTLDRIQQLYNSDPSLFGATGRFRQVGRDVTNVVSGLDQTLGTGFTESVQAAQQDALRNADPGVSASLAFADPNITEIDILERILAYGLARVQNPDGRISNDDYRNALDQVALRGFTKSQAGAQTAIDTLRRLVEANTGIAGQTLRGGAASLAPPPGGESGGWVEIDGVKVRRVD